jgi:hypothetical protein
VVATLISQIKPAEKLSVDLWRSRPGCHSRAPGDEGQVRPARANGGAADAALAASLSFHYNCNEVFGKRSQFARKAETLFLNVDAMIKRVGIEHCGFLTRTFAENITCRKEAELRNHSWNSGFAAEAFEETVSVPQRQARGAFHYHDIVVIKTDIRTGFDFDSCTAANDLKKKFLHRVGGRLTWASSAVEAEFKRLERKYFASANENLRALWRLIGNSKHPGKAAEYGFGRCEMMPILSNAAGCARYVGAYAIAAQNARAVEDKGMRTVRYAIKRVPVFCDGRQQTASLRNSTPQWNFAHGAAAWARKGCQCLSTLLGGLTDEQMKLHFGKKWRFRNRKFVSICAENFDELLATAGADPFNRCSSLCPRPWYRRLLFVRSLLLRYDFPGSSPVDLRTAEDHFLSSKRSHLSDYEP